MAALVSGELVYDGGCLYLVQEASGVRYPILWPAGTRWDATGPAVRPPVGQALSMRSRVSGGGGYLQLDQVRRLAGPQAADVANKCLDNTDGEVAVVNNADNAITLAP